MGTDIMHYPFENTTRRIIGAFYEVYNQLGSGFLEKVYENAMLVELKRQGLQANAQHAIKVQYKGTLVGEYMADIMVNEKIICETRQFNICDRSMKPN